jgi:hypothetical protein
VLVEGEAFGDRAGALCACASASARLLPPAPRRGSRRARTRAPWTGCDPSR